jgi:hypothetical protein
MAVVYQHRRKDTNEIFYVGIGKTKSRAYSTNVRNSHWKGVVNKVGYEVDIILEGLSWNDACKVEVGLIEAYGRSDRGLGPLTNQTDGGDGAVGHIRSKETIEKTAKSNTGKTRSEETKVKMRKPKSEEHKDKLRKPKSEKAKQNMSRASKNKPKSEEHRKRNSEVSCKSLFHVPTGLQFKSGIEAADYFKVSRSKISREVKKNIFIKAD